MTDEPAFVPIQPGVRSTQETSKAIADYVALKLAKFEEGGKSAFAIAALIYGEDGVQVVWFSDESHDLSARDLLSRASVELAAEALK